MKKLTIFTAIFLFAIKVFATSTPEIIITEIMYNPEGSDSDHEWIEILNFSTSTEYIIDSYWRFNDGSNHQLNLIQGDEIVSPQEYLVLVDDSDVFLQDYPDYQGSLIDTVMSLNNSSDFLSLSLDAGNTFFATTTYQSDWGGNNNGFSLELINQTWQESFNLGGTPGRFNITDEQVSTSTGDDLENATNTPEVIEEENATSTDDVIEDVSTSTPEIIEEDVSYSNQIIINEVLPNPQGSDNNDEWIELYNRGSALVDLIGWQLSDATDKKHTINSSDYPLSTIEPFGYFVVYRAESGIALNNNGDIVKLYQPNGNLLDQIEYTDSADENWSYSKNGGSWQWTKESTPGNQNIIKLDEEEFKCPASQIIYLTKEIEESPEIEITPNNIEDFEGLRINEILPNPQGSDTAEWIEFYNNSSSTINLFGLSIDDGEGGSKPYQFSASSSIKAFEHLLVFRDESKLALNNSLDSVRLITADNEIFASVDYQKAKDDFSYAYDDVNQEWFWTASSTPGQINVTPSFFVEEIQIETVLMEENNLYSIKELKSLDKGIEIETIGIISSLPDILGKNMFYITEEDLSSGIQVYASTVEIPEVSLGDEILIKGKMSEIQGEKRINLLKDSKIEIIQNKKLSQPELILIDDINDEMVGNLIYVSGELVERKGSNYYLDDGTAEIRMYIKTTTGIEKLNVEEGFYLDVIGILTLTKSGYRLLPRFQEDINVGQILGVTKEVKLSDEVINTKAGNPQKNVMKYSAYGGGSILAVLLSLIIKLKLIKS